MIEYIIIMSTILLLIIIILVHKVSNEHVEIYHKIYLIISWFFSFSAFIIIPIEISLFLKDEKYNDNV